MSAERIDSVRDKSLDDCFKREDSEKCLFCGSSTVPFDSYRVCENCKTVSFTKNISQDEKAKLISSYINGIMIKIHDREESLFHIDQKVLDGLPLSCDEQEIHDSLTEFQSIKVELEKSISNASSFKGERDRNLLYRLLMLSEWLNSF